MIGLIEPLLLDHNMFTFITIHLAVRDKAYSDVKHQ
jgi:hypothetical protein